ncbi:MAG: DUF2283 domain-containing protein [Gemmatimonadota bacterium]|nr:DUF2283 domain-containing protein [Gemmatimonadota bacterium]
MKVTYDPRSDTLTVILKEDVRVAESDEDKPGIILDYDDEGNLLSLEILDASRRVTEAAEDRVPDHGMRWAAWQDAMLRAVPR